MAREEIKAQGREDLLIFWNGIQIFDLKVRYFNNTADPETQAKVAQQDCPIFWRVFKP